MKKIFAFLILLISILTGCNTPESLSVPEFSYKAINNCSTLEIEGIAYPKANIALLIEDVFVGSINADRDGKFYMTYRFQIGGEREFQIKQIYKEVESSLSEGKVVSIDVIPPNPVITINSNIPQITNNPILAIEGTTEPKNIVSVLENRYVTDETGYFKGEITLKEGENNIDVTLSDSCGNNTIVKNLIKTTLDTKKPILGTGMFYTSSSSRGFTEEEVYLTYGTFQGYNNYYNIPITGSVKGDIKSVLLGKTYLTWNTSNQISQVVPMYLSMGTNNINVLIEDLAGNKKEGYLSISVKPLSSNNYSDDYEDLESRINDLESEIDRLD
ncbi:MAG: hypothetical protein PHU71_01150 [Candidatus Gracilibacteria bacterium]|nr:hypothetical protein [Candidatus Gracilibacteria bacterium]